MTPRHTRSPWIPGPPPCTYGGAERGFTLIEAVVALLILGSAVLAVIEATAATLRAQHATERNREALAVAEWRMNALAAAPIDSLRHYLVPRGGSTRIGTRRYAWRVASRQDAARPAVWQVAVMVMWPEGRVTLETARFLGRTAPGARTEAGP